MQSSDRKVDTTLPVLVTGATGYVAGVIIQQLLDLGVTVHGTVRDPSNKGRLQYIVDYADASPGSVKFFRGDLLENGSFADAMEGCGIVFHTASPFLSEGIEDVQAQLIAPAVEGTKNVLNQATKTGSVKRVVLTSSAVATATDPQDSGKCPITEENWNGTATLDYQPYFLSKTLAEQAAWIIAGSQNQWTMVTINPGFILGPGLKYHALSESFTFVKQLGDGTFASGAANILFGFVDVRDVARAHVVAAYKSDAKGRHIVVGHNSGVAEVVSCLAEKYGKDYPLPTLFAPKLLVWLLAPYIGLDRRWAWSNIGTPWQFDSTKTKERLGIEFHPLKNTMQDMFQQLIDEGVISNK